MQRSVAQLLRPSSMPKYMHCPGAAFMESRFEDSSTDAAREGSVAHALAECTLNTEARDTTDFLGMTFDEYPGITVDTDMCAYIQEYVDYVTAIDADFEYIEWKIDFPSMQMLPNKGTADHVKVNTAMKHAYITDLKYGYTKVYAKDNEQLMTYALGVMMHLVPMFDIDSVTLTIVQPRLDWIDHVTLEKRDLIAFAEKLSRAVQDSLETDATNVEERLVAGPHCEKFCAAQANCKAYAEYNARAVADHFEDLENFDISEPGDLTPAQVSFVLTRLKAIEKWSEKLKERALRDINAGKEIPGFKVVRGSGRRAWADKSEIESALKKSRLKQDVYAPRTLCSPAQLEKLVPKGKFDRYAPFVVKSEGKPTLAPESDKRPSIAVADQFEDIAQGESECH